MTKERLKELLDNILGWGSEHSDEFMQCMVSASGMTAEEAEQLECSEWCKED